MLDNVTLIKNMHFYSFYNENYKAVFRAVSSNQAQDVSYRVPWRVGILQKRLKNDSKVALKETGTVEELLQGSLGKQRNSSSIFSIYLHFVHMFHTHKQSLRLAINLPNISCTQIGRAHV